MNGASVLRLAVVGLAFSAALGCASASVPCDHEALATIVGGLKAGTTTAEGRLGQAIAACPGMPVVLGTLRACVTGEHGRQCRSGSVAEHPAVRRPLCGERVLRRAEHEPRSVWAQRYARECELDRFALLADDEPFYLDDAPTFAAHAWMLEHGARKTEAAAISRSLLLADGPRADLAASCEADPERDACDAWLRKVGVNLARSAGAGPLVRTNAEILVRPTALPVAARVGLVLGEDELAPSALEHHRVARVVDTIARTQAEAPAVGATVYPDATLSYGAVVDVLYSAAQAGADELGVVVGGVDGPGRIAVWAPATWSPDRGGHRERACTLEAELDDASVRLSWCLGESVTFKLDDLTGIAAFAEQSHRRNTIESGLALRAPAGLPWQTVVQVLDAVRGPDSPLTPPWDARVPDSCWFCRPSLDLSPPIPRRAGDWDRLQVSVAEVRAPRRGTDATVTAAERARAEAAVDRIEDCLRGSAVMRVRMPERVSVIVGKARSGTTESFALATGPGVSRSAPCVAQVFAPLAEQPAQILPGELDISYAIALPEPP